MICGINGWIKFFNDPTAWAQVSWTVWSISPTSMSYLKTLIQVLVIYKLSRKSLLLRRQQYSPLYCRASLLRIIRIDLHSMLPEVLHSHTACSAWVANTILVSVTQLNNSYTLLQMSFIQSIYNLSKHLLHSYEFRPSESYLRNE